VTAPRAVAAADAVAAASDDSYARIVATLIRVTGDWTLSEDCAQDALAAALERWPADGVPANPGGWLMTVSRNRAIDVLRRTTVERRTLHELAVLADPPAAPQPQGELVDDRLRLIFTCCHPALPVEARVALTLRTVGGVPTADIARAFLVSEAAMTRRLTRAKTRIAEAGIPYRVPTGPALRERLPGVLAVLYLLFTRGYDADGEPAFADEAIRLARLLERLMPDQPEVSGLLALFLFQHSRHSARRDTDGNLVTLERQDRSRWDRTMIAAALDALTRARAGAGAGGSAEGPYALQARIAAGHATAPSFEDTDWPAIAAAYDRLGELRPSPVIALNRAVAHGYADGPAVGLALLAEARAGGALDGYPLALAAEAALVAQTGDRDRGAALFRAAAAAIHSEAERRALLDRAEELSTRE
jgi:RNA polymerase sigma-70 factor (ECF subfamily)